MSGERTRGLSSSCSGPQLSLANDIVGGSPQAAAGHDRSAILFDTPENGALESTDFFLRLAPFRCGAPKNVSERYTIYRVPRRHLKIELGLLNAVPGRRLSLQSGFRRQTGPAGVR